MYQWIYSTHISYLYFNPLYLKLLVSQSKLSGIRKVTLKYKLSEMNFDFEISRVDYFKRKLLLSFPYKNTSQSLETPSHSPTFFSEKTLSARSTPMHLVYKNKNILFPSIQLIIHSLAYVDHLTGGLQQKIRVDKNI